MMASLLLIADLLVPQPGMQPLGPDAPRPLPASFHQSQNMINVAVTLKPGADINTVAAALAQAGLVLESRLDAIGSITGKATPQVISRLRTVVGVDDVSELPQIQIAPPDSRIQ